MPKLLQKKRRRPVANNRHQERTVRRSNIVDAGGVEYNFIDNEGVAQGSYANMLMQTGMSPGILRPFIDERDHRSYITVPRIDRKGNPVVNRRGEQRMAAVPTANAQAIFFRREWEAIDEAVQKAAMPMLKAWPDLRAANTYRIAQGMGATSLVSYMRGDITPAQIAMNPITRGDKDHPLMDSQGIPLPVIFKDCDYTLRDLEASRLSKMPLDTTNIELATEKVAEEVEKLTIGIGLGYSFNGYSLYGYANYPARIPKALTDPTDNGWTPKVLYGEIAEMRKASRDGGYNGPWNMYVGSGWELLLDDDYSDLYPGVTLRERIQKLNGIRNIETLDFLQGYDILLVQMTANVARAVTAMEFTTLQWPEEGGLNFRMKIMCILVPQLRQDFYGNTGIVHGTVAGS